ALPNSGMRWLEHARRNGRSARPREEAARSRKCGNRHRGQQELAPRSAGSGVLARGWGGSDNLVQAANRRRLAIEIRRDDRVLYDSPLEERRFEPSIPP